MRNNQIKHYLLEIWKAVAMILLIIALILSCAIQLQHYKNNKMMEEILEKDRANSEEMEKMIQETGKMVQETKGKLHDFPEEEE